MAQGAPEILSGRCDCLRNPDHWEPGCTAVDEHGNEWVAVGGNDLDGAEKWQEVKP